MESTSTMDVRELQAEIDRLKTENQKLKASNRRWMRIAGTAENTGLPNKIFFSTALLPQLMSKANTDGDFLGCIMIEPDGLVEINEKYGRRGADFIVKEVAEFLKGNVESDERLVHIDGATFVILLPQGDLQTVRRKGLTLRAKITNRTFDFEKNTISLTLSMGGVVRGPGSIGDQVNAKEVAETFLRRMGVMLDRAKHEGGNRVELHEDTDF